MRDQLRAAHLGKPLAKVKFSGRPEGRPELLLAYVAKIPGRSALALTPLLGRQANALSAEARFCRFLALADLALGLRTFGGGLDGSGGRCLGKEQHAQSYREHRISWKRDWMPVL